MKKVTKVVKVSKKDLKLVNELKSSQMKVWLENTGTSY